MKKKLVFLLPLFFTTFLFSQTGMQDWEKVFDDSEVGRIDITIDPDDLAWIYANVTSDVEFPATMRFQNKWFDETLDSIGFRLRGNTSRQAQKKSFKIAINSFFQGRNFHGLEKLNLNGEHNDPSIVRSKLSFEKFGQIGLKGSRSCHMEVYINGRYYGLYISVEHIDEEFLERNYADDSGNLWKCLWPADLQYLGENPSSYITLGGSRPAYELSTNEDEMDFSSLIRLTRILNNTPVSKLIDSLETTLDYVDALKYFSMNILLGQWDDYWSNMNNYYLYHEPANNLIHVIPYDYDNTFGIDWFNVNWSTVNPYSFHKINNGPRPLIEKMLVVPELRNLYTRMLIHYKENVFALPLWNSRIDSLRELLRVPALLDTFRTKDYNFSFNDFLNSYSASSYSNQHVKFGLKQYIQLRNNSLEGVLNYNQAPPLVYEIDYLPKNPGVNDSIFVTVSAFSLHGLDSVVVQLHDLSSGVISSCPMKYSPVWGSKLLEENDRFTAVIPPLERYKQYRITIRVRDYSGQIANYPRAKKIEFTTSGVSDTILRINEILADNASYPDPSGDFDDFVELFNSSDQPITLTGKYLTDKSDNLTKWRFEQPGLVIEPYQFVVIWCDEEETQPGIHANFKLSKSGELVYLVDTNGVDIIDSVTFGQQITDASLSRIPDGSPQWMQKDPTPGGTNTPGAVDNEGTPEGFYLSQNYPNPFNPETVIRYHTPSAGAVSIKVYDQIGNLIKVLVNEHQPPGEHSVAFDAGKLASGVYFYRISVGNFSETKKMLLLR
ncbi:hypothetical protein MASR2M39_19660 [Ignavibacteriales bacterium]